MTIADNLKMKQDQLFSSFRGILGKQPTDAVNHFLKLLEEDLFFPFVLPAGSTKPDDNIKKKNVIKAIEAIKNLQRFIDNRTITTNIRGLEEALWHLDYTRRKQNLLVTGGRPLGIAEYDLIFLAVLRKMFAQAFPRLKGEYTKNGLLTQLGEQMLGVKIGASLNKRLDEFERIALYKRSEREGP